VRQERFFALEEGFAFARSETKKLRRRIMPQRIMPQWVRKKLAEMRRAESAGNAAGESSGGSSFGDPEKVDDNQPLPEACHFRCENRVCRFCGSDSREDAWETAGECPDCHNMDCGGLHCPCQESKPTSRFNKIVFVGGGGGDGGDLGAAGP
jgi:hypothetical protein